MFVLNSYFCRESRFVAILRSKLRFLLRNTGVDSDFSTKHDLARSCFKLWPKIGDEGDKISGKKTGEALAETVFFQKFFTLGADFESRLLLSQYYHVSTSSASY